MIGVRSTLLISALLLVGVHGASAQDGKDSSDRLAELDQKLRAAFTELAAQYDKANDPEAAAFFCECAIGLGSTDENVRSLKKKWEDAVYLGRTSVGEALKEGATIDRRLASAQDSAQATLKPLQEKGKGLSESERGNLAELVVRFELASRAREYVEAVKGFNSVRRRMKLRAVLWDYAASKQFILGAWHIGETALAKGHEEAVSFTPSVAFVEKHGNGLPDYGTRGATLATFVECIRPIALGRQDLLNPDVRRLWLGHFQGGRRFESMMVYAIPREEYRPDIATPTARSRETVAAERDGWQDIEQRVRIKDRWVVYAHYPYDDEVDAPRSFPKAVHESVGSGRGFNDPQLKEWTRGLPIMLRFFDNSALSDVSFELRTSKGERVPCRQYLNGDKRVSMDNLPTVLLFPERPLEPGVTYTVAIKCKLDGTPIEKTWTFTTRSRE